MKNTKLQLVLSKQLLNSSEEKATAMGFSSVQEMLRVFLVNINNDQIQVSFTKKNKDVVYITPEYENFLEKRLKETLEAIKRNEAFTARNAKEFFDILDGKKKN